MKKTLYFLILFLISTSCNNKTNITAPSSLPEEEVENVVPVAPRVYLNHKEQFLKTTEINRLDVTLNLSDKIVFAEEWRPENDSSKPVSWSDLEEGLDFKVKVSSFCSYERQESKESFGDPSRRVFKEMSSSSYAPSFSIFEILPQEILLDNFSEVFYCSFIFAFKNEEGQLNHYNIAQQAIRPLFEGSEARSLSLIREAETGYYLPVIDKILPQHISKVSILNNTGYDNQKYHLLCSGLKLVMETEINFNVAPMASLFLKMANNVPDDSVKEGLKTCRFISEHKKNITGMTNPFQLDLSFLKNSKQALNVKDLSHPVVLWLGNTVPYGLENKIPLNGHFSFENLKSSEIDYSAVDIIVNTRCVKEENSAEGKIFSGEYKMPFRKKFPVMSLTPKDLFLLDMSAEDYKSWLSFLNYFSRPIYNQNLIFSIFGRKQSSSISCFYNIELKDRYDKENKVTFDLSYRLKWNDRAYGMDHKSMVIYLEKMKILPGGYQPEDHHYLGRYKSYQLGGLGSIHNRDYEGFYSSPYTVDIPNILDPVRREKPEPEGDAIIGEWLGERRIDNTIHGAFRREKPFLSIKWDIYQDEVNYFYPNFFDVIDDSAFQFKGPGLDRVHLQCHTKNIYQPIEISFPYSDLNQNLSLKPFFLNHEMIKYVERHKIVNCRLMLYEDEILRYFSQEIRVIP